MTVNSAKYRRGPMPPPPLLCLLLSLTAAALAMLGGCNIVGPIAASVMPPPDKPAEYKPPQEPLLVFVENFNSSGMISTSDELAQIVCEELKEHKVAPLVDQVKLAQLRAASGDNFSKMRITDVGRTVGARQVLYISLEDVEANFIGESDMMRGKLSANVKMVDVETGRTMWPISEEVHNVMQDTQYVPQSQTPNTNELRHSLCENVGYRIARLFYAHKEEDESEVPGNQ